MLARLADDPMRVTWVKVHGDGPQPLPKAKKRKRAPSPAVAGEEEQSGEEAAKTPSRRGAPREDSDDSDGGVAFGVPL